MLTMETKLIEFARLRFSADGRFLAVADGDPGDNDEECEIWDLRSASRPLQVGGLNHAGLEWHPVKPEFYTPHDLTLEIVDPGGELLKSLSDVDWVQGVAFSPAGDWMVLHSPFHLAAYRWTRKRWQEVWTVKTSARSKRRADSFQFVAPFPDGRRIAVLVNRRSEIDGQIEWSYFLTQRDLKTGAVLVERPLGENEAPVGVRNRLAVMPDGAAIVGFHGRSVYVWPTDTAQRARKFTVAKKDVWDVALHPSGRWVATVCNTSEVSVCDLAAGKVVQVFDWGIKALQCVAISPDGSLAAVGGANGEVAVWDWV